MLLTQLISPLHCESSSYFSVTFILGVEGVMEEEGSWGLRYGEAET